MSEPAGRIEPAPAAGEPRPQHRRLPEREGLPGGREEPEDASVPEGLALDPIAAEDDDRRSSLSPSRASTYPADFSLESLHRKWRDGEIEVPDFQRGFVWDRTQASRLVESFLLGLPVPAIYLYNERGSDRYLVIDGQQRLRSVFFYFEGHFPARRGGAAPGAEPANGPDFRLVGLSPSSLFRGCTFDALPDWDQRRLRNRVLRAYIVRPEDPNDDASLYDLFERLNTGGTRLENQEIRHCIYRGPFVDLLDDLNGLPSWRAILGRETPDRRRRDTELILRFFALRSPDEYRKPMKQFLSQYLARNRHAPTATLLANGNSFSTTCDAVVASLGDRPFHRRGLLNVAVLDSVLVAFAHHLAAVPDDIRARYETLTAGDSFRRDTGERTTDADRLRRRFREAARVLFDD